MSWGDSTDPTPPRSDRRMPANCTVLPCAGCVPIKTLSIQSLEFVGDHGVLTDYRKDFKSGGQKFPKPEFEWAGKHAHPVSYSMGQTIEVYLTFQVEPANACPETGSIFGQGPEGIFFDYTNHTFTPGTNKVFMTAKKSLTRKVQILDFEVLWRTKGISAQFDFFGDFTKNTIYVTYDTPYNDTGLDNEVTEKRLEWLCSETKGHTNGHDSMEKIHKIHKDREQFSLNAPTPRPHWDAAAGEIKCQCVDLAKFWMLSAEMLGLRTGEVVYLYPKLSKGTKESSNPEDMETRAVKTSVPPHGEYQSHGNTESLMLVDNKGGWNRYEACYKFTHPDKAGKMLTRYYAGGADIYDTKEEVMKDVCKETKWIYHVEKSRDPVRECTKPGPSPAESWE